MSLRKPLEAIRRKAVNIAEAACVAADLPPAVASVEPRADVSYNDPALTECPAGVFRREPGGDAVGATIKSSSHSPLALRRPHS